MPEQQPTDILAILRNLIEIRNNPLKVTSPRAQSMVDQDVVCVFRQCHEIGLGPEAERLATGLRTIIPPKID